MPPQTLKQERNTFAPPYNKKWHYGLVFRPNGQVAVPYYNGAEYLAKIYGAELVYAPSGKAFYRMLIPATRPGALKYFLTGLGVQWNTWQGKEIASMLQYMYNRFRNAFRQKFESMYPFPDGRSLRAHQIDTLMFGCLNTHYIAALDQGTGKTITAISKSLFKQMYPTLIVCEASAKENWRSSLVEQWGFDICEFTVIYSQNRYLTRALNEKYIIINYDLLVRYKDFLIAKGLKHIILDECQRVKNVNSQRYKAIAEIVKKSPEAHITFASGTPVTNRMDDMYAYLKLIGHPRGKSKAKFETMFLESETGHQGRTKVTGAKNLGVLRAEVANLLIRYRLEDCWDMPKKNFIVYTVDLGEWKEMYENEIKRIADEEFKSRAELENNIHTLNRIISMAKVNLIKDLMANVIESGRKVVVFGGYRDPILAIKEAFPKSAFIDGSVASHKRQAEILKFRNNEDCMSFIGNMKAAGTSIELQNSSDVFFLNWPFVPPDFAQAVSRVYRAGQKNIVNVYTILVKGTIDEYIWKIMETKMKDIDSLIDGKAVSMKEEDIIEKVYEKIKAGE
jgi:SWI/SNF-related matrix-associated actin-dependent regulator of chromatin subfamily A-like protein 1